MRYTSVMSNQIVKEGYNKVAKQYSSDRDQVENNQYLDELNNHLRAHASVLDIGCGAGLPVDRFLVEKGYKVTGIDISEKMIELAKRNIPLATFKVKDMSELQESEYHVDAVVSFYAIFHTPREKHQELFNKINSFLSEGGFILITMGAGDYEDLEDNFHGEKMWWSHYGPAKNRKMIENEGFEILLDKIDGSADEKHQIILAKKQSA